jgi:hypothetical protein
MYFWPTHARPLGSQKPSGGDHAPTDADRRPACRSLLIPPVPDRDGRRRGAVEGSSVGRRGAIDRVGACKSLLISRSMFRSQVHAAEQHSLVNISENTSAADDRCGPAPGIGHWIYCRKWQPQRECTATRAENIKREQASYSPTDAGRRAGACRSLLIPDFRPPPEPVRSGGSRVRPDGQRLPRRPPSRLTESGGRR